MSSVLKGFYKVVAELIVRLAPIVAIIGLGLYLNKLFEALLALVAILQFELAYRQHWFNKARSEPLLAVYAPEEQGKEPIRIEIENLSPTVSILFKT